MAWKLGICEECGREFGFQSWDPRIFCSRKCYGLSIRKPKKINICKECGEEFETRSCIHRDFCSRECANTNRRAERIKISCLNCRLVFEARINDGRKFCSNKCADEYHSGINHFGYNLQDRIKVCEYCGNEFEIDCVSRTTRYCSIECRGEAMSGENHPMWKGNECLFVCENCGTEYRDDSHKANNEYNFCSNECRMEYMVDENHPCWKGHDFNRRYPSEFNDELREQIRDRDGRMCQMCLMTEQENGEGLQVHHIDWDKLNCDQLNLISLCIVCHGKVHGKENTTRDHLSKLAYINSEVK